MKRLQSTLMAALAIVVAAAYAFPAVPAAAQSSSSLSIAPKKNYIIEQGKSVKDKLTIRNLDSTSDLSLSLRVVDFTYTNDGGTPKLFLAEDAPQTTWSLKPFMTIPKTVTIPKSSSKTLDMSVAIPAGHGAGSYYSAIIYSTGAGEGSGNVGLAASGVTLVFTQIPGKVNEDLKLKDFGIYNEKKGDSNVTYTNFTLDEPQKIAYTLENKGNVTEAPAGTITLSPLIGKPIEINDVNPSQSLALIGQTRTYSTCIKLADQTVDLNGESTKTKTCVPAGLWPGYYKTSLSLYYGQNGNRTQEIVGSSYFWFMPLWFIVLIIVVIAALAYFGWRFYHFIRRKLGISSNYKKQSRRK